MKPTPLLPELICLLSCVALLLNCGEKAPASSDKAPVNSAGERLLVSPDESRRSEAARAMEIILCGGEVPSGWINPDGSINSQYRYMVTDDATLNSNVPFRSFLDDFVTRRDARCVCGFHRFIAKLAPKDALVGESETACNSLGGSPK